MCVGCRLFCSRKALNCKVIHSRNFTMQEAKDSTLPLSRTPDTACKATKEELLQIRGVNVLSDCPACLAYGTRCLVAAHPSAAALTGN